MAEVVHLATEIVSLEVYYTIDRVFGVYNNSL